MEFIMQLCLRELLEYKFGYVFSPLGEPAGDAKRAADDQIKAGSLRQVQGLTGTVVCVTN